MPENMAQCQTIWETLGISAWDIGKTTNTNKIKIKKQNKMIIEINVNEALSELNAKNLVTPGTPIYNESLKESKS